MRLLLSHTYNELTYFLKGTVWNFSKNRRKKKFSTTDLVETFCLSKLGLIGQIIFLSLLPQLTCYSQ